MTQTLEAWKQKIQADENFRNISRHHAAGNMQEPCDRLGICKIVSTGPETGQYQVTLQHWLGESWYDASEHAGFADLTVRDFRDRDFGQVGQRVLFWVQCDLDGTDRVWIDVTSRPFIQVCDQDDMAIDQVSSLRILGDNGISSEISAGGDGQAQLTLALPDGLYGGDLLTWDAAEGEWKVLEVTSCLDDRIPWLAEADDLRWTKAFFSTLGISGTEISGVAHVHFHPNDPQNSSAGPIRLTQSHSGSHPETSVDVVVSHYAPHASSQTVTVRDAAGTGTVTLEFDRFGHFIQVT
jgi:hypothetical protein